MEGSSKDVKKNGDKAQMEVGVILGSKKLLRLDRREHTCVDSVDSQESRGSMLETSV